MQRITELSLEPSSVNLEVRCGMENEFDGICIQTITIVCSDGKEFRYSGPVQMSGDEMVVGIKVHPPTQLGPEYKWSEISEMSE